MDAALKERRITRKIFSQTANKLESILETKKAREIDLKHEYKKFQEYASKLENLDTTIKKCILESEGFREKTLEDEMLAVDEYRSRWLHLETRYELLLKESSSKGQGNRRNFDLPKLEFRKYDGSIKKWLSFWGQFKKIHEDPKIDEDDKIQYLLQCMEHNTEVYSLVESYPQDGASYKGCIEELKQRYAREELLIEVYVRELLTLVLEEKHNLQELYDKLNANLRCLETLGVQRYEAFILPLVESALPVEVLQVWERTKSRAIKEGPEHVLPKLMHFLKTEVESTQRIQITQTTFNKKKEDNMKQPSASCLVAGIKTEKVEKTRFCIWCDKDTHSSVKCYKLYKMTIEERTKHLKKKKACLICLKEGHYAKICKAFIKCHICGKRHTVAMCPGKIEDKKNKPEAQNKKKEAQMTTTNVSSQNGHTLLQTVVVYIRNEDQILPVQAIFDSGSQRSYVKADIVEKLQLKTIGKQTLSHCLFGNVSTQSRTHNVYNIQVESLDKQFQTQIEAISQPMICGYVPKVNLNDNVSKMLKRHNIVLTDTNKYDEEIGLLIGADFAGLLLTSGIVHLENGMVAINTRLGWTLQGKQKRVSSDNIVTSMFCVSNTSLTDFWSLETLGIRDPAEMKTKSEHEAEIVACFEQSLQTQPDGRYEVQLPFKVGHEDLLSNIDKAQKRLECTTKKLVSCGKFHDYNAVFQEWFKMGIIEKIPSSKKHDTSLGHFLPHKAVIKESSLTSAIRPVFDASCPDKNGRSLNSCLEKGLNYIDHIYKLLVGFRKGAIGITSDIAKAFLQISLTSEDRNYLKFLWWEDESLKKVVHYRHCRVVFGLTSSPFLLSATLMYHLDRVTGKNHETAQLLKKSFYVDNCLTSLDTENEARRFIEESKEIMSTAKFDLRMWVTSPLQINEAGKETISVLGLNWNTVTDELSCNIEAMPPLSALCSITKRLVLSLTQRIFDPVGITCPVTLPPKILLQEMWRRELTRDEPLPEDLTSEFKKWYANIGYLKECQIPRRVTADKIKECNLSLHMFSDASKLAMAACVFLRAEKDGEVTVQLMAAKSRVAPSQNISIPRLELMAAVVGIRLLVEIRNCMPKCEEYYWTDSSVTLYWICKDLTWNVFVGNRVKEIRESTKIDNWCHISGSFNWADLASRGCDAKQLLERRWTEGPKFLLRQPEEWPRSFVTADISEAEKELKKSAKSTCNVNVSIDENFLQRLQYFSNYSKIVRMVAWMFRFKSCCLKNNFMADKDITNEEFLQAEQLIIRLVQQENKHAIEHGSKGMHVFYDKDNLLRIKTKLLLADMAENTKFPMLVPAKCEIIQKMLRQRHIQLQHAGMNILITDIRKTFWVIGIRRLARSVISNCIICKIYSAKQMQAPTAPLPVERIESSAPFENTGVDMAGPLYLRNGEKCWIVLYTCAVYRAIHLELTSSLSTEAFIRTFRRFIARRGRVKTVITDNGTHFVGTKNLLESIDWSEVQNKTSMERIKWKLNAPTGAWWGGFFERLIRSMKDLLRRVLGKACVTYDELQTLLCDCESVMNHRPLTYIQDDKAESLEPLSPACFLQPLPSSETTDFDVLDSKSLNVRLKYLQKLRDDFRQRFRAEYLTELVQRGGQKYKLEEVKVGKIVLLETDEKRVKWPLGIITKIFPGKDGVNRTVEVKTATGIKVRPIQRLYSLEISGQKEVDEFLTAKQKRRQKINNMDDTEDFTDNNDNTETNKVTRCGRKVKIPSRYHL